MLLLSKMSDEMTCVDHVRFLMMWTPQVRSGLPPFKGRPSHHWRSSQHYCIICKLDDGIGAVPCYIVVRVQGVQQGAKYTTLGDTHLLFLSLMNGPAGQPCHFHSPDS